MEGTFYSGAPSVHPKDDNDANEDMEIEEGLDLPPKEKDPKDIKMVNPVIKFDEYTQSLTGECKAMPDVDGGLKTIYLVGELPNVVLDKFPIVQSNIMQATTGGFEENVTSLVIGEHIIATPVHIAPLLVILKRHKYNGKIVNPPSDKWSDSISVIRQLLFFRIYFYNVATLHAEYKKMCMDTYNRLKKHIDDKFFNEVDEIAKKRKMGMGNPLEEFGVAYENYMIDFIRVLEWTIMDAIGIPVSLRGNLLTPNAPNDARVLTQDQGNLLRYNLVTYLKLRKDYYTKASKSLQKDNKFITKEKKDEDMEVEADDNNDNDNSNMELMVDRLKVSNIESNWNNPAMPKFKGYICYSTLETLLNFLEDR